METPDYYAVLGIAPESDEVVVQASYKALMRKYHPDTNKDPAATARATAINQAYAVLSDPVARANYDFHRQAARSRSQDKRPPPRAGSGASANGAARVSPMSPKAWQNVATGAMVVVGLVIIAAIISPGAPRSVGTSPVNSAAGNLSVAQPVAAGVGSEMEGAAVAMDNAADAMVNASTYAPGGGYDRTQVPVNATPTTLSFKDIEAGARQFDHSLADVGMSGAKTYSEKCHAAAQKSNEWARYDFCTAFDFAAAYVDAGVVGQSGSHNAYFQFMAQNALDQYEAISSNTYLVQRRLEAIRQAAGPAVTDAINLRQASRSTISPPENASK